MSTQALSPMSEDRPVAGEVRHERRFGRALTSAGSVSIRLCVHQACCADPNEVGTNVASRTRSETSARELSANVLGHACSTLYVILKPTCRTYVAGIIRCGKPIHRPLVNARGARRPAGRDRRMSPTSGARDPQERGRERGDIGDGFPGRRTLRLHDGLRLSGGQERPHGRRPAVQIAAGARDMQGDVGHHVG